MSFQELASFLFIRRRPPAGIYKQADYGKVILLFTLRCLGPAKFEATKDAVVAE